MYTPGAGEYADDYDVGIARAQAYSQRIDNWGDTR